MTTTAIIAAGEARAAHVTTMPRTQLIRGVDMDDKMQLKITGKNSDGEYWLHLVGGGQNAGFNLGDPSTMAGAALLKAASGQRFVSVPAPADPVRDALIEAVQNYKDRSDEYFSLATDRGGHSGPKGKAFIAMGEAYKAMIAALTLAKGEKP